LYSKVFVVFGTMLLKSSKVIFLKPSIPHFCALAKRRPAML
jgi:hypothetical protein